MKFHDLVVVGLQSDDCEDFIFFGIILDSGVCLLEEVMGTFNEELITVVRGGVRDACAPKRIIE